MNQLPNDVRSRCSRWLRHADDDARGVGYRRLALPPGLNRPGRRCGVRGRERARALAPAAGQTARDPEATGGLRRCELSGRGEKRMHQAERDRRCRHAHARPRGQGWRRERPSRRTRDPGRNAARGLARRSGDSGRPGSSCLPVRATRSAARRKGARPARGREGPTGARRHRVTACGSPSGTSAVGTSTARVPPGMVDRAEDARRHHGRPRSRRGRARRGVRRAGHRQPEHGKEQLLPRRMPQPRPGAGGLHDGPCQRDRFDGRVRVGGGPAGGGGLAGSDGARPWFVDRRPAFTLVPSVQTGGAGFVFAGDL